MDFSDCPVKSRCEGNFSQVTWLFRFIGAILYGMNSFPYVYLSNFVVRFLSSLHCLSSLCEGDVAIYNGEELEEKNSHINMI